MRGRIVAALAGVGLLISTAPLARAGTPPTAPRHVHGGLLQLAAPQQSNNWSGYNQGSTEKGTTFHQISGDWVVPTATPHKAGESEFSSTWIGIGGGCEDTACNNQDQTLIQTGTEQDVVYDALAGTTEAQYSAWYELIPDTGQTIDLPVNAGDHMHASIVENGAGSNNWTITIQNVTQNKSFTTTVDYTSDHGSAEFIEETPVVVSLYPLPPTVGFATLPKLSTVTFSNATVNGAPAGLTDPEQMQLIDLFGNVEATPSSPTGAGTGFDICSYSATCPATTSSTASGTTTGHRNKR